MAKNNNKIGKNFEVRLSNKLNEYRKEVRAYFIIFRCKYK